MKETLNLVTLSQAKQLMDEGFDYPCYNYYHIDDIDGALPISLGNFKDYNLFDCTYSCPSIPLALKFFRDERDLAYSIDFNSGARGYRIKIGLENYSDEAYKTFDEAENAILNRLLKIK
jgi:hypothetical protein